MSSEAPSDENRLVGPVREAILATTPSSSDGGEVLLAAAQAGWGVTLRLLVLRILGPRTLWGIVATIVGAPVVQVAANLLASP